MNGLIDNYRNVVIFFVFYGFISFVVDIILFTIGLG